MLLRFSFPLQYTANNRKDNDEDEDEDEDECKENAVGI